MGDITSRGEMPIYRSDGILSRTMLARHLSTRILIFFVDVVRNNIRVLAMIRR